ncbi:MAG: hypothetical protein AAFN94_09730 [Pseudomonadota bacterium]
MTRKTDDTWIDALLDDVCSAPVPEPGEDVMARILSDAMDAQPAPGGGGALPRWRQALQALGGWMSVGGLVAATAVGFAVGLGGVVDAALLTSGAGWADSAYYQDALSANGWDLEDG